MVASSRIESLAARFEPYIQELREFFASRNVAFGTPASLNPFLDRLRGDPAFLEEMVSMVRSILYREEALPRIELMEMIAVAVGGLQVQEAEGELHRPMREILAFVQEVARAKGASAFAAPPPHDDSVPVSGAQAAASTQSWQEENRSEQPGAAGEPLEIPVDEPTHFKLTNDRLSRSLMHLQDPEPERSVVSEPDVPPQPVSGVVRHEVIQQQLPRRTFTGILQRSYWIPGLLVLVLAVAGGLLLEINSAGRQLPSLHESAPLASSGEPKPSADGEPSPDQPAAAIRDLSRASAANPPVTAPAQVDPGYPAPSPAAPPARAEGTARPVPPSVRTGTRAMFRGSSIGGAANPLNPREGVFLASSGAMASHLLSAPAPAYPKLASLTHTEGQVIVQVVVDRNGRVEATRVLDGPHLLRGAAEHAIRSWRYRPYLVDGRATDVATIVTVSFRLR